MRLPAKSLTPGTHSLLVSCARVPGELEPSAASVLVTVLKARANVRIASFKKTVRRGTRAVFAMSVRGFGVEPSGTVRVKVDGRSRTVELGPNGRAKIKVPVRKRTDPEFKRVVAAYSGDSAVRRGWAKPVRSRVTR